MKRFSIVCGLILASTLLPVKVLAATFSQLVVYGDSLSDLGRAAAASGNTVPPYGGSTGGRFSNGPIWVEYLAASLGIPVNPSNNFAIGGAATGTVNIGQPLSPSFIGIQTQVASNPISDPAALYVIWGGANDYLFPTPLNPINPTQTIANLAGEINTLIGRGATNILVPNLPNLGALPSTLNLGTAATDLNNLTAAHNAGLAATIANLSLANPTVKLDLLDVNSLFSQVVANPVSFGFNDVTTQCITATTICSNPSTNLFWDDIHPTTAGHQLIGNLAFNTVVPEPTTILGSILASGAIIAFKRKLQISKKTSNKSRVLTDRRRSIDPNNS
jgi:thermolabile hemolysin